jgi:alpha,alpha-trehalose phosphorylase
LTLALFLLGDAFSLEEKKRNFEFYDPLTTGDASLSSCVEAIVATQIGDIEKAVRYGMAALLMDFADVGQREGTAATLPRWAGDLDDACARVWRHAR